MFQEKIQELVLVLAKSTLQFEPQLLKLDKANNSSKRSQGCCDGRFVEKSTYADIIAVLRAQLSSFQKVCYELD